MGYNILNINNETPQCGVRYLFDANIWLAILDPNFNHPAYVKYIDFFNCILVNKLAPEMKIAMPGILLSEVINKILKSAFYPEYLIRYPIPENLKDKNPFKNHYRPSTQYAIDYENICASIRAYHSKIEFISDHLHTYTCKALIKKLPTHMEFNDYLICKAAEQNSCVVVTNDADMKYEGITVITSQRRLLDFMKQS